MLETKPVALSASCIVDSSYRWVEISLLRIDAILARISGSFGQFFSDFCDQYRGCAGIGCVV
jgi:hypothetical protein